MTNPEHRPEHAAARTGDLKAQLTAGETLEITVERMAHGGEGIGTVGGRVVFVRGGLPGDTCLVRLEQVKKRYARGKAVEIRSAGGIRVAQRCPAAAAGAGCCDFGAVDPDAELGLKVDVLRDQLTRLGGFTELPPIESAALSPTRGWRTRVRLGVDAAGRAGVHHARSRELVTDLQCAQVRPGLLDGVVGPGARKFTPGAQVIVAEVDEGRQIVETRKTGRGRRAERVTEIIEGPETGTVSVGQSHFQVAATAFWQAHAAAPAAYSRLIARFCEAGAPRGVAKRTPVAWDLYGGVGLFVPALDTALGGAQVHTVDSSPSAAAGAQPALAGIDHRFHCSSVERAVAGLPAPDAVVLDPPRTGAGAEVVAAVAAAGPRVAVHVGCDPATLARDLADWRKNGYWVTDCQLVDAFPGTHHFEVVCRLVPAEPGEGGAEDHDGRDR